MRRLLFLYVLIVALRFVHSAMDPIAIPGGKVRIPVSSEPPNNPINLNYSASQTSSPEKRLLSHARLEMYMDGQFVMLSLVAFLLRQTSQRQVIIVFDDSVIGISDIVKSIQASVMDTILLEYDADLATLEVVLRSTFYVDDMRNVLLLCSPGDTTAIFERVREYSLESSTVRWLVVTDEDITLPLQSILREGTQVALALRNTDSEYLIFSSFVNTDDEIGFARQEKWAAPIMRAPAPPDNLIIPSISEGSSARIPEGRNGPSKSSKKDQGPPLFPSYDSLYNDFQGRRLIVSVVSNVPFFKLRHLADGTAVPDSGIDFQVMESLCRRLNFTYEILEPEDGRWGGPESDGTVSGMVGDVANHRAHLAIDELTITEARESVVDFTRPYYLESTTLVSRSPSRLDSTLAIFQPFTVLVWLSVILMTSIIGPVGFIINKFCDFSRIKGLQNTKEVAKAQGCLDPGQQGASKPYIDASGIIVNENSGELQHIEATGTLNSNISNYKINRRSVPEVSVDSGIPLSTWSGSNQGPKVPRDVSVSGARGSSLSDYSFNMLRSLVVQGNYIAGHHNPVRIVLVSWYIFCLVIYSLYAGTLTSFMTFPAYEKPIDSLQDLKEGYKDGFVPGVQAGTSNEYFLQSAKSGIFKELWKLTDPTRSFPPSGHVGIDRVLTDNIVYMSASLNSEIRTSQRGRHRFYLARQTFFLQGYGIACRNGSPYKQKFNEVLNRILQGGLITKWIKDEVLKIQGSNKGQEGKRGQRSESQSLSLNHLQAAFFLLLGGSLLSAVALLMEIQHCTRKCIKSK